MFGNILERCVAPVKICITPMRWNCYRASLGGVGRKKYTKSYETIIVNPDGSTFTARFHEPRKILMLPVDMSTLSEEERLERIASRKPQVKIEKEEIIDDSFSLQQYAHMFKKKK